MRKKEVDFWTIAGIGSKDKNFWKELEEWEVMVVSETWLEEKERMKTKRKLLKGYI